jgi:hypothetical protein
MDYANLIALWLGIKTAGTWNSWSRGVEANGKQGFRRYVSGRQVFNIFLTGTALNLAFVALGDRLIHWLRVCALEWHYAGLSTMAAAMLSLWLLHVVRPRPRHRRGEQGRACNRAATQTQRDQKK